MADNALWSPLAVIDPLKARLSGVLPKIIGGISIDTRTLGQNDLFFAIKGERHDGHDHVAAAFAKGAAAAVVDEVHSAALKSLGPLYVVRDVMAAMQGLAIAARARTHARIVGVTGSVGKTSTKEALRVMLDHFGPTHAAQASYNNHWGVPLTLARMARENEFGVFEIGMSHAGEITPLTKMVRPHIAIITTIAPVHLEFFSGIDGIAEAKAEIFLGLEPEGTAIINRDIPQYDLLLQRAQEAGAHNILSFGINRAADAQLVECIPDQSGSRVEAMIEGRSVRYFLGAPGRHMALNSLAVLLAGARLGLELDACAASLAIFRPPAGRGLQERIDSPNGAFTLLDESYNANPASMKAALDLTGSAHVQLPGRRIVVLGDMLELGESGPGMHAALARIVEENGIDLVYAAGPLMKKMFDALPLVRQGHWAARAEDLVPYVLKRIGHNDLVMVKGSNGSRMGLVVSALKRLNTPQ